MNEGKLLSSVVYPEFFSLDKNDVVLNAGCGGGPQAIVYKGQYKEMVGVDVNCERLKSAQEEMKKYGIDNFRTICASVEEIPLESQKFDKIIAIDILEHVLNPDKMLKELKRLMDDNGLMLITFPAMHDRFVDAVSWIGRKIFRRRNKKTDDNWNPDAHQYSFNIKEWLNVIERNGFKVEKCRATTMFPPLHYYGVPKFWFKNKTIRNMDNFFCKLPGIKNLGQTIMCVCTKKR